MPCLSRAAGSVTGFGISASPTAPTVASDPDMLIVIDVRNSPFYNSASAKTA